MTVALALALSLASHLFVLPTLSALRADAPLPPNEPRVLRAQLKILPPKLEPRPEPEASPAANPHLKLKPSRKNAASPIAASKNRAEPEKPLSRLAAAAKQQFEEMDTAGRFYPVEAIQMRLQGTVGVQLFFDEEGKVIAVRLAESSGYPLLDAAATRAARSLQSLPSDGLETVILPVVFRLGKVP